MSLISKTHLPSFQGPTQAVVPTATFSGKLTDNAADSINPYTSQGPGEGGAGQTWDEVNNQDADYSSVSLLLNMDGSNGSTSFTDLGPVGQSITVAGNAQVTTTDPKFGSGSLLLDGTGDYLQINGVESSMVFGTGDLTIEGWINIPSLPSNGAIFSNRSSGGTTLIIGYGSAFANGIYVHSDTTVHINGNTTIALNTWHHWAYTVESGTQKLWFNGQLLGSAANYDKSSTNAFRIGNDGTRNAAVPFNGKMDDIRVTKGVARYTSSFTPPTVAHPTQ